jgi:hypothetical protein
LRLSGSAAGPLRRPRSVSGRRYPSVEVLCGSSTTTAVPDGRRVA